MQSVLELSNGHARQALARGAPVFLPVNPVEFHGPHLSVHTDALVSAGLMRDLHENLRREHPDWPLLVLHDLDIGVETVPGPGSRPVPYPVACRLVETACTALADLGARRVVIMTFHGSPLHELAIQHGIDLLARRGVQAVAPFNALVRWQLTAGESTFAEAFAHVLDPEERRGMIRRHSADFHAGFLETSLALHYAPDSVDPRYVELPPCPALRPLGPLYAASRAAAALGRSVLAAELEFAALGLGWFGLRPFPGYTGKPHLATARSGAVFARCYTDAITPAVLAVLEGRAESPPPLMAWLSALSLGGRLFRAHIPLEDVRSSMPGPTTA